MSNQIKSKQQQIIGKAKYLNPTTNKMESFSVIQDSKETDFNFHKIWIKDLAALLELMGGQKLKVFAHILSEMNTDNIYFGSIRKIAERLELSDQTVSSSLKILKASGQLRMLQNGVYMLSPDLAVRGKSLKRQKLRAKFHNLPFEIDEIKTRAPREEREYNDLERSFEDKIIRDHHIDEFIEDLKNK